MADQTYTRQDFLGELKAAGLTQVRFAELCGLAASTVHHWGDDRNPIPVWAVLLVSTLAENAALRTAVGELSKVRKRPR